MRPLGGLAALVLVGLVLASGVAPGVASSDRAVSAERPGDGEADLAPSEAADVDPAVDGGEGSLPSDRAVGQTDSPETMTLTQEFSLTPETPGEVRVRLRYEVADPVVSMETTIPADATYVDASGFDHEGNGTYAWDETTLLPSVTYAMPVNRSVEDDEPGGPDGTYVSVDAGEWALFQRPSTNTQYAHTEAVEFDIRQRTVGPGATGEWLVYLGEHETYERRAHGQTFSLVVPTKANTTAPPPTILESLVGASDALRVGDRDEAVFAVAAPTDGVAWGARGATVGDTDMWVRDSEPVASADNAWIHEYVHTRQAFTTAPEMAWFEEASASYYAALLTLEQRRINYTQFRDRLAAGDEPTYHDVVLSNRSTWEAYPDYDKGALVAGQVDRRIRLARGNGTLAPVVRAMNDRRSGVTVPDYRGFVNATGGTGAAAVSDESATTATNVSTWNLSAHVTAFGRLPPRVTTDLPANRTGAVRVTGPYRNVTLNATGVETVRTGERIFVRPRVENHGNASAEFNATLRRNGSVVSFQRGTLAAGETRTPALTHTFSRPGRYELGAGTGTVDLDVREPPSPTVEAVRVDSRRVPEGEDVLVTVIAGNDDNLPATGSVRITRDGEPVAIQHVVLDPNETEVVQAAVPMPARGAAIVRVNGDEVVPVRVYDPSDGTDGPPPTVGTLGSVEPPQPSQATDGRDQTAADAASSRHADGVWVGPVTGAVALLVSFGLFVRRLP